MSKIVFIVDDNQDILTILTKLLESVGMEVTSFDDGQAFLDAYTGQRGCVLLDLRLPSISGIKVQETLKQRGYSIPVVFISGHGDIPFAVKAIQNGAVDFITKPFVNQDLIEVVQLALRNDKAIDVKEQDQQAICARINTLTDREKELLLGIIKGKLTKQIAHEMAISTNTAEVHRAHVMQKMQAKTLGHLLGMVFRYDLEHMLEKEKI